MKAILGETVKKAGSLRFLLLAIALILFVALLAPSIVARLGAGEEYPCSPIAESHGVSPALADTGLPFATSGSRTMNPFSTRAVKEKSTSSL